LRFAVTLPDRQVSPLSISMPRILSCCLFFVFCALSPAVSRAQPTGNQVSKVFAVLSTSIDTKTAARGDEVSLSTMNDLLVGGKVVIPKGSKLIGRVSSVSVRGKNAAKSALAIVIEKAIVQDKEIPLQAIVAAIAAPATSNASKAANAETQPEKPHDEVFLLKEDSAGAIGYQGVSLAWNLTIPPASTIFAVDAKSLKLVSGTQMLLRMIPPQGSN
jgi:hypothetical protein